MDEKIIRLKKWMENKKEMPYTLEINPTNNCNLKCGYCWQQNFENIDKKDKLKKDKLLDIIRESANLGVKEIRIPGSGEPFIRKDIIDIMREIKINNIYGLLITNGILLDEYKIRKIVSIRWDCLTFSFDSANKKVNDYFRGKGSFDTLKKNLILFDRIKRERKSNLPFIRFNIVITNKNYKVLPEIIEFAKEVSCQDVEFQPITVWSKNSEKFRLSGPQQSYLKKIIPAVKSLAEQNNIYTNIGDFLNNEVIEKSSGEMDQLMNKDTNKRMNEQNGKNKFLELPCFEPWYNMIILPEGKVTACSMAGPNHGDNIINKSLKNIWLSDYYTNLREALLNKELPDYCKKCCAVVFVENQKIKDKLRNYKNDNKNNKKLNK